MLRCIRETQGNRSRHASGCPDDPKPSLIIPECTPKGKSVLPKNSFLSGSWRRPLGCPKPASNPRERIDDQSQRRSGKPYLARYAGFPDSLVRLRNCGWCSGRHADLFAADHRWADRRPACRDTWVRRDLRLHATSREGCECGTGDCAGYCIPPWTRNRSSPQELGLGSIFRRRARTATRDMKTRFSEKVRVSLQSFVSTGAFGPISLVCSATEVERCFGDPESTDVVSRKRPPAHDLEVR